MSTLKLNAIQHSVLSILKNERKALSAYALLEKSKPLGVQSPMQIYRILKKLLASGFILKIETLNKYLAYELKHTQGYVLMTICRDCQGIDVINSAQFTQVIRQSVSAQKFHSQHSYLELVGQCAACSTHAAFY